MTAKGGGSYGYDYKDRLHTQSFSGSGTKEYLYNTSNRMLRKTENGKHTYFFHNGDRLICEKFSQGKISKIYTHDDEGLLGMKHHAYDNNTGEFLMTRDLYYLFNSLGSVTAITDDTGMPVKYYHYDPFGNVTNTTEDPINNFTFVGRYGGYKDWDSGFINFHNRWYDSELGKWISRDPIGELGGMNLYAYADNNPVNRIDITGLDPEEHVPAAPTPTPDATGDSPYTGRKGNNDNDEKVSLKCVYQGSWVKSCGVLLCIVRCNWVCGAKANKWKEILIFFWDTVAVDEKCIKAGEPLY